MDYCNIQDCLKRVKAKGLCSMHHQRMRRHGDPNIVLPRRTKLERPCTWVNCDRKATSKGLCPKHYYIHRVSVLRD
ncbi:hypothetical protein ET464_07560 [Paenibacillus protaetiae]|uniref:Uncharacterized protein n=1 Tax=Paenibacillus protaetiae TaxID=2509456 RepID=A0A4P6ET15_9BACL|nr:hypothetical protein ET464_07560 [Paenibacillus protaetiae]